ncbi:hypothetical protein M407DRAFT_27500 [Tulasnella calospora MUT 4182]|uniref:Uncharacterized protein n=1 Tax=Tulasnella calospora MUT 4182 TaxID=1051891 RepID=A0A0C3KNQ7_9AGAM|nr:hypothetical protein M407DRAFT_27500 [Tulasnella calospora MUT 4182]
MKARPPPRLAHSGKPSPIPRNTGDCQIWTLSLHPLRSPARKGPLNSRQLIKTPPPQTTDLVVQLFLHITLTSLQFSSPSSSAAMANYIAIVPPANLVHSIYDFYVEQQSWVSTQLQNSGSPRAHQPLALSPPPFPSRDLVKRRKSRASMSQRRSRHINLDLRTRLTYLPRQSPVHSRHLRRHHAQKQQHLSSHRLSRRTSTSTRTASPPTTPPRETLSPTPVPATAGMTLLAMYGDMVKDRMQSCMRLEEMVRDARSKDLFAVSLF